MRLSRLLVPVVIVALVSAATRADIVDKLDDVAPPLTCTKWWNGKAPRMGKPTGRVTLLNFHDPTRLTSKAFEGRIKALADTYADRPFDVVEILVDCAEVDGDAYVARAGATWLVGLDDRGDCSAQYQGSSVPRTYVIGPDGKIAWHAHVGALVPEVLDSQFRRAAWYDDKKMSRDARAMVTAARELRFGTAVKAAEVLQGDVYATEEERTLAADVLAEVDRYWEFQAKVIEGLIDEREWTVALRRAEAAVAVYRGTARQKAAEALRTKIAEDPRAIAAFDGERDLERIVAETDIRKTRDLEKAIAVLERFVVAYENYKVAERAESWIKEYRRLLEKRK